MYQIGVKNGQWTCITDGQRIFISDEDIRYYAKPPAIGESVHKYSHSYLDIVSEDEENIQIESNRVKALSMVKDEFQEYCKRNGFIVRGAVTSAERARKLLLYTLATGTFFAVISNPILTVVAVLIAGSVAWQSDYEPQVLAQVFERAKEANLEWEVYDKQKSDFEKKKTEEYLRESKIKWSHYWKLRNLSSFHELTGAEFEAAIAAWFKRMGFEVTTTKATGDFGVDVIASKNSIKMAIQAKRYSGSVGIQAIQEVFSGGKHYNATHSIVVTNSDFTRSAIELSKTLDVKLIDRKRLAILWHKYGGNTSIPQFSMEEYEALKREIEAEFYDGLRSNGQLPHF